MSEEYNVPFSQLLALAKAQLGVLEEHVKISRGQLDELTRQMVATGMISPITEEVKK